MLAPTGHPWARTSVQPLKLPTDTGPGPLLDFWVVLLPVGQLASASLPCAPSILPARGICAHSGAVGASPRTEAQQLPDQGGCSTGPRTSLAWPGGGSTEAPTLGAGSAGSKQEQSRQRRVVAVPAAPVACKERDLATEQKAEVGSRGGYGHRSPHLCTRQGQGGWGQVLLDPESRRTSAGEKPGESRLTQTWAQGGPGRWGPFQMHP